MRAIVFILILTIHADLYSQKNNIRITYSSHSTCDDSEDPDRIRQRIINRSFINDTLTISLGIVAECDLDDPLVKLSLTNDTLDFKIERKPVIEYDSVTKDTTYSQLVVECDCCYQFDFRISGLGSKNCYIRVNNVPLFESNEKYKTYPVQFELTQNGDTINYSDKYGLRQGLWLIKQKDGGLDKIQYMHGKPISFKKYYSNGQIKCDCICRPDHDAFNELIEETGDCRYWDENGKEIYQNRKM